jgi:hypothetical protein
MSEGGTDFITLPERGKSTVRLEVFTAVLMKVVGSSDVKALSNGKWFPTHEFTGLYVPKDLNLHVRILTEMGLVGSGQARHLPIKHGV